MLIGMESAEEEEKHLLDTIAAIQLCPLLPHLPFEPLLPQVTRT